MTLKEIYTLYGDAVYVSLMSQYTPIKPLAYEELNRCVSEAEYVSLVSYARSLGVKNAFVQDAASASERYIPNF